MPALHPFLHILVVDDRPDSVLFLTEFLHSRGHRVESCTSATDALEAVVRRWRGKDAYHLVITDISMPVMDGVALVKELRRRQVQVASALYTGHSTLKPQVHKEMSALGCLAVLDKPVELRRVELLIEEVQQRLARTDGADQPFFGTSRSVRTTSTRIHRPSSETLLGPGPGVPAQPPTPREPPLPMPPPDPPPGADPQPPVGTSSERGTRTTTASGRLGTTSSRLPLSQRTPLPLGNDVERLHAELFPDQPGPEGPPPARSPGTGALTRGDGRPTGTVRRPTGLFPPSELVLPPSQTTARVRRSISGSFPSSTPASSAVPPPPSPYPYPAHPTLPPGSTSRSPPPSPPSRRPSTAVTPAGPNGSRAVSCAHCRKVFLVLSRPESYVSVCVHCGKLNRIDPL